MIWFTKSVSIFRRFKCVRFNFKCLQPPDSKEWKKQVGWYIPRKTVQFSCSVVSDSVTPWTAACQASVSITNSQSLLEFMSIESVMPFNHLTFWFLPIENELLTYPPPPNKRYDHGWPWPATAWSRASGLWQWEHQILATRPAVSDKVQASQKRIPTKTGGSELKYLLGGKV